MKPSFDLLGLGVTTIDDLIYVEAYPPPDAKMPIIRSERQGGGLTATALVAAARLGARCAYAGLIGDDDLSRFVLDTLARAGIDTTYVVRRADARPIHSTIIVDQRRGTRNIFFEAGGAVGADANRPAPEVILAARVLFVDHYGLEGMVRAARIAREAGIPVVADLERYDDSPDLSDLLELVDHLVVSQGFAQALTGQADPALATVALWTPARQAVVVTCGEAGSWFLAAAGDAARHQPAYPVEVVDTTGCGDVFHGAYAAALARNLSLPDRVRFASAAAALKATRPGGQAGIPDRTAVAAFLAKREADDET